MLKTIKKNWQEYLLIWITIISFIVLFFSSSLRHYLFHSTAYDLGIFDQATYLISQGKTAITTVQGFHIMGDHAAWIYYLLAIPYKIYPSVYWLFIIQSLALSLGVLPTYYLSVEAGLKKSQAIAMTLVYLLYPVVFNANLFDFHSEVIAVPLILSAILAARLKKLVWFCLCIILILGCKAVLSLTVMAMGIGLLLFEKRRLYGAIAIVLGVAWFIVTTKMIIPFFSGEEVAAVGRYSYLGDSVFDILKNLIFQPQLILSKVFTLDNLGYLVLLLTPIFWGLSTASLKPLFGAIPCVAINLLADYQPQKDLVHQYSLPALPFLIVGIIATLAIGKGVFKQKKYIILWSLIGFLALAKFTHFTGRYLTSVDTLQETREAVAMVKTSGGVYTTAQITPHLSNRELIKFTDQNFPNQDLEIFDYILLNIHHPGWASSNGFAQSILNKVSNNKNFKVTYEKNDVYLFEKNN